MLVYARAHLLKKVVAQEDCRRGKCPYGAAGGADERRRGWWLYGDSTFAYIDWVIVAEPRWVHPTIYGCCSWAAQARPQLGFDNHG